MFVPISRWGVGRVRIWHWNRGIRRRCICGYKKYGVLFGCAMWLSGWQPDSPSHTAKGCPARSSNYYLGQGGFALPCFMKGLKKGRSISQEEEEEGPSRSLIGQKCLCGGLACSMHAMCSVRPKVATFGCWAFAAPLSLASDRVRGRPSVLLPLNICGFGRQPKGTNSLGEGEAL